MSRRPGTPTRFTMACVLALCVVLAGGIAVACGEDSSSSGDAQSPFAGLWEPVEAQFDITWDDGSRSYSLSTGGSGGGLEVVQSGKKLTVTLVGMRRARSDALPATVNGQTLTFPIPISEEMPTDATLTSTGEGTATLTFAGQDNTWDFRKTDEITLKD